MSKEKLILRIIKQSYMKGYIYGYKQPTLYFNISIQGNLNELIANFDLKINEFMPNLSIKKMELTVEEQLINRIIILMNIFNDKAKIPILDKPSIRLFNKTLEVFIPVLGVDFQEQRNIFLLLLDLMNGFSHNFKLKLDNALTSLYKVSPQGINSRRFIELAYKKNIPFKNYQGNYYQFGWGVNAIILDSTISNLTPAQSTSLSKNKIATKNLLNNLGLPTAKSFIVNSYEDIIKYSNILKFPVVIKPFDQDQGKGVFSNINSIEILKKAYKNAKKFSKNIMIEKHFKGIDYRLHICKGEIYYTTFRIPAGIIGDGRNNIDSLIRLHNKKRVEPPKYKRNTLIDIQIDEETIDFLKEQNLTTNSIPYKGQFIQLKRTSNVSRGGSSVTIKSFDTIHPDNITLAKRAVTGLRLDIGAVDLLIPDISKSWMESGAIITEVNAQPQLGGVEPINYLLDKYIIKQGRIPIIVILGQYKGYLKSIFKNELLKTNKIIGILTSDRIYKNNECITNNGPFDLYSGGTVLINDPSIESIVLFVEDTNILKSALPVDEIDLLAILGYDELDKSMEYHLLQLIKISKEAPLLFKQVESNSLGLPKKNINDIIKNIFQILNN